MASDSVADIAQGYNGVQKIILAVTWIGVVLSSISVAARFYVRTIIRPGALGWDDVFILLALGWGIASHVMEILLVKHGNGRHVWEVAPADVTVSGKLTLFQASIAILGTMTGKMSVCFFLLRMVKSTKTIVSKLIWADLAIFTPVTIAVIVVHITQCKPIEGYWDPSVDATCIDKSTITILLQTACAIGVVTDFMTATIAVVIVHRLKIVGKRKRPLIALLALGYLIAVFSILRTAVINWSPTDYTYDNATINYWNSLELLGGIIVACAPTLQPLYTPFKQSLLATRNVICRRDTPDIHDEGEDKQSNARKSGYSVQHQRDDSDAETLGEGIIKKDMTYDVSIESGDFTGAEKQFADANWDYKRSDSTL